MIAAKGSLLGTALGDSLGLPYEGLSASRGQKLMPFPLRQRLLGSRGSLSDDTVQSALVLQALAANPTSPEAFQKDLARRLRLWLLTAPPGVGLATLKACLRLNLGAGPERSGRNSAGNGGAMRAPILGAALWDRPHDRVAFVDRSTRITHTHPLAIAGAQLVALAASLTAASREDAFDGEAKLLASEWPWSQPFPSRGPSGYVVHTVNAAIQLWKRHGADLRSALEGAIQLGGDTDTVAAIVGGIIGAAGDRVEFPGEWMRWIGWPSYAEIESLPSTTPYLRLAGQHAAALPSILLFGFRRVLPPY